MVVASFLGVGMVTHYAIAARITQLFMELMMRALGVIGPVFMRLDATGDPEQMRRTFLLATRVSTLAAVTVAGGIVILGERLIELWIGEGYLDAYWPLVILTSSLAVALMQMPSVSFLYASARHRFFAYLSTGEAIANLGLSIILVQHYGMIGVSVGTAIPLLVTKLILQPRVRVQRAGARPARLLFRTGTCDGAGGLEPSASVCFGEDFRYRVIVSDADSRHQLLSTLLGVAIHCAPSGLRPTPDR